MNLQSETVLFDISALSAKDSCLLRGMMRLIENRLTLKWVPSEDGGPADIVFVDADSNDYRRSGVNPDAGSVLSILCSTNPIASHPRLLLKPMRIHGPNGLIDVLNRVGAERHTRRNGRTDLDASNLSLDQLFQRLNSPASIEANGVPVLYVAPPRYCFVPPSTLSTRSLLESISGGGSALRQLTAEEAGSEADRRQFKKVPFHHLIWTAHLSDLIGHKMKPDTKFRLKRWPEFAQLGYEPAHLAYAAVLTRRPASADELSGITPESTLQHALSFLAACSALNLLDSAERPAESPRRPIKSGQNTGVLRAILRRLGRRYA